ncbi:MAG: hypothetical protein COC17_04100 [Hyphomicrobiales bacterium]|nr:hypothetical protein [Hyphomicrobiales bacterium]PCH50763.1 MAG: hypothetical protein COC17_04100 [Hyphomicrobiales bacterium]
MTLFRIFYSTLLIVTIGIYLTMVIWVLPEISAAANGQVPFDMRPTGYTFEEAIIFLKSLSEEGRILYLGLQHTLDAFFPGLLGILLVVAFIKLMSPKWAAFFSLFAIAGSVCDYLENSGVKDMLTVYSSSPPMVTPEMVSTVSYFTVLKSLASTIAYVALLVMLVKWGVDKYRAKKSTSNQ